MYDSDHTADDTTASTADSDARATGARTDGGRDHGGRTAAQSRRTFLKAAGAGTLALGAGAGAGVGPAWGQSGGTPYNLAEALQKSLYFYDANMCGEDVSEESKLIWRGDCHDQHDPAVPLAESPGNSGTNLPQSFIDEHRDVLDPDGTGTVDVAGGYHDAGDHVKFGPPEGYSASTVAWAVHEFEDAFRELGIFEHAKTHLRRFAEYFLKSTFRADDGSVVTFCHQVGDGGSSYDHNYWGPAELQTTDVSTRPAYFAIPDDPAGSAVAQAAAALAVISTVFEGEDDDFASECLDNARALYDFAVEYPGTNSYSPTHYEPDYTDDDLAWAAIWLHIATEEDGYLEDLITEDSSGNFSGHISRIIGQRSDEYRYTWVHCWNNVWGGTMLKLAQVTDDQYFWDLIRWHLEFWSGGEVEHEGSSGNYLDTTPGGFSWRNKWGSARYNAAAQMTAMVYRKYNDTDKAKALSDWALGQMEYIMGDSPIGYSLIVGFTDDYAEHPHHDTAHGSITGKLTEPPQHRHTLWGALVGGPDLNGNHDDSTDSYTENEVAIDYNAGFVGALAGLYTFYSDSNDETVSGFLDRTGDEDPYYVEAAISSEDSGRIDYTAFVHNMSFHPAQYEDGLSFRYFLDASELEANGSSVDNLSIDVTYDQVGSQVDGGSVSVVGPEPWDEEAGIYYIEFDYSGVPIHGRYELSFAVSEYTNGIDPSNDPSYEGLSGSQSKATHMPVYVDGEHVWGTLPDGTTPPTETTPTTTTTTEPTTTTTTGSGSTPGRVGSNTALPSDPDGDGLYEDVNGNSRQDIADAVDLFRNRNDVDAEFFDFNESGGMSIGDAVSLFRENTG